MNSISLQHILLIYLVIINVGTFFLYGLDKAASKRGQSQTKKQQEQCDACINTAESRLSSRNSNRLSYAERKQARPKVKWKAKHSKWRISEATLLGLAVIGGSIGAWLGMKVWHHKTMHKKFKYGLPLILIAQIALVLLTSCRTKQTVAPGPAALPRKELSAPIQGHKYEPEHSPNVFLVMYDEKVGKEPLQKAIKKYKCEIIYDYNTINGMALKKPEDRTLEETMQYFKGVKGVTTVEYDHIIRLTDPVKPRLEIQ